MPSVRAIHGASRGRVMQSVATADLVCVCGRPPFDIHAKTMLNVIIPRTWTVNDLISAHRVVTRVAERCASQSVCVVGADAAHVELFAHCIRAKAGLSTLPLPPCDASLAESILNGASLLYFVDHTTVTWRRGSSVDRGCA